MNSSTSDNEKTLEDSLLGLSVSNPSSSSRSLMDVSAVEISELDQFDDITAILAACKPDLSRFLDRFKKAFIINSSVPYLTESVIAEIFKKEIGLRPIFSKALHEFCNPEDMIQIGRNVLKLKKPKNYIKFSQWKRIVSINFKKILASQVLF